MNYSLPPLDPNSSFYPPSTSTAGDTNAALSLTALSAAGAEASTGRGGGGGGGGSGSGEAEKKKQTRGARACTVCRKLKMRCVGAEQGPPCKRCKNGGHECVFEESQRGKRSGRKTDAMAKSLKSMEQKLESVLSSLSHPALLAGSGGLVTDPSQRVPYAALDSGPGGAEGRGDLLVGSMAGEEGDGEGWGEGVEREERLGAGAGGGGGGGTRRRDRADSNSAIIRKDPIQLPPLSAALGHHQHQQQQYGEVSGHSPSPSSSGVPAGNGGGGAGGVRFDLVGGGVGLTSEIGPSRTGGHPIHHSNVQSPYGGAASAPSCPYHPHPHHHQHRPSPPATQQQSGLGLPNPPPLPSPYSHPHHQPPQVHFGGSGSGEPTRYGNGRGGRGTSVGTTSSSGGGVGGKAPLQMEWSGVRDQAKADGSPRLHSLPDNTLNPLGLLAEASLRNTRHKRPAASPLSSTNPQSALHSSGPRHHDDAEDEDEHLRTYDVTGDLHHASEDENEVKGKRKGKGKAKGKGKEKEQAHRSVGGEGEPPEKRRKMDDTSHSTADGVAGEKDATGPGVQKKKAPVLGMANRNYFAPGPMNILPLRRIVIEQRMPPALLEEKILSVEEVVELFEIFFSQCARHCPFLDAEIHTPAATGSRSPFLFTCICTVAARYYTKRTDDLYRKCLRIAKRVAFDVMTKGYKSTEICQGFLLLCNWNQPSERFEEERTYQFSGIAIRMATDLNLHRKTIAQLPPDIAQETRALYERELLNRERTWLYCFICDRSVSTQMGKPYSISKEDFLIRNASTWHRHPNAQPSDSGLSAMVEMQRIVGRVIDVLYSDTRSVSGLNAHLDYPMLIRAFLQQLDQWRQVWSDPDALNVDLDEGNRAARAIMRDFYHAYYRLFLLSFAVQHALDDPSSAIDLPSYCVLCFESAERMIIILRDFLAPQGILRYAIDSTFVYASYAATFLLKLVSPTFATFIDEEAAMRLVRETAEALELAAVDEQHTPALYASFLRMLIENKLNGGRTAANSRAPTRPASPTANGAPSNPTPSSSSSLFPATSSASHPLSASANGTGLESFLKSRAPSLGPDGYSVSANGAITPGGGLAFDPTLGGAFPGGLGDASFFGAAAGLGGFANMGGEGGEYGTAAGLGGVAGEGGASFDSLMVDDVLSQNGFWSSMLMPGFGGPLAGLSGGSGTVFSSNPADPFSLTPFHSRAPSPSQMQTHPATGPGSSAGDFDYSLPPQPPAVPAPAPVETALAAPVAGEQSAGQERQAKATVDGAVEGDGENDGKVEGEGAGGSGDDDRSGGEDEEKVDGEEEEGEEEDDAEVPLEDGMEQ
ncbi:hypothetical protein JCM11641_002056 [Rhodosporidiobolus odoratus]